MRPNAKDFSAISAAQRFISGLSAVPIDVRFWPVALILVGCAHPALPRLSGQPLSANGQRLSTIQGKIVRSARDQLTWGTTYDPSYVKLKYPGGDVPKNRGVCTDVVIRALRNAGHDLQELIYEDKKQNLSAYPGPARPQAHKPDPNIDHRRVPNQAAFFKRHGKALTLQHSNTSTLQTWLPGDIVTWILDNGRDHCGIVTDKIGRSGLPMVVHNLSTTLEEDCLTAWKITGHFRYPR